MVALAGAWLVASLIAENGAALEQRGSALEQVRLLNRDLERRVGERTASIEQLRGITELVAQARDPDEIVADLLPLVARAMEADHVRLFVLDQRRQVLVGTDVQRSTEPVAEVAVGEGIAGAVAAQRRPIVVVEGAAERLVDPVTKRAGVASVACVPLVTGGELMGTMLVGSLAPRNFDADDVAFLQRIAEPVAAAVERRAVEAATRRRAERADVLATVSRQFQDPGRSFQAALDQAVDRVAEVLDATVWVVQTDGEALEVAAFRHRDDAMQDEVRRLAMSIEFRVADGMTGEAIPPPSRSSSRTPHPPILAIAAMTAATSTCSTSSGPVRRPSSPCTRRRARSGRWW